MILMIKVFVVMIKWKAKKKKKSVINPAYISKRINKCANVTAWLWLRRNSFVWITSSHLLICLFAEQIFLICWVGEKCIKRNLGWNEVKHIQIAACKSRIMFGMTGSKHKHC